MARDLLKLSEGDLRLVRDLRECHVLQPINPKLIDFRNGAVVVGCADGDHILDLVKYYAELQRGQRPLHPCVHLFTEHGGALCLAEGSPANEGDESISIRLLSKINRGIELKGISTVILNVDAPCGQATATGISLLQSLSLLESAKRRVKNAFRGEGEVQVVPAFRLCFDSAQRQTFFSSRGYLEEFLVRNR